MLLKEKTFESRILLQLKTPLRFIIYIFVLVTAFSCVPRKKLLYLQEASKVKQTNAKSFASNSLEYRLKPDDVVSIHIFSLTPGQFNIFSRSTEDAQNPATIFTIDRAGFVELPAIGQVEVNNLTIKQAQDKIRLLLEEYLKSPLVRIELRTPFEFTILGEVNKPGHFTKVGEEITLFEALGSAGDLTRFADRSNIKLVRKNKEGQTEIINIDVLKADLLASEYYHLRSEDVIIVDPLGARGARENQLFFLTSTVGIITSLSLLLSRIL
ncbi:polysaccharide biosynthesis/export family protein [Pontibacter sp. SGAir0037]|uniref:polysaccharide biosynthesis/export family protein n=1 Tax=Pontibacter sp. SGAir0037 TaxID=2571030 RepID=UPI0010CD3F37|nr:polysaccharide biosynthesis/export family protein [Pontibacter sp. SGAir0037]QCR22591.1 hypothetical protein C1N53_09745 [Pontibacter sp. SGAir0037]